MNYGLKQAMVLTSVLVIELSLRPINNFLSEIV